MQLFNWVSKRHIAVVYGIFMFFMSLVGAIKAQLEEPQYIFIYFLVGSILMVGFVIVDFFTYKFYPLEAGVFIDATGRS